MTKALTGCDSQSFLVFTSTPSVPDVPTPARKPANGHVDQHCFQEIEGYLPGISELQAKEMLQGQPKGSYLIFTSYSK